MSSVSCSVLSLFPVLMVCTDIIFGSKVPSGVGKEKIDIGALKTLGDEQVQLLEAALGGSGSANSTFINP